MCRIGLVSTTAPLLLAPILCHYPMGSAHLDVTELPAAYLAVRVSGPVPRDRRFMDRETRVCRAEVLRRIQSIASLDPTDVARAGLKNCISFQEAVDALLDRVNQLTVVS